MLELNQLPILSGSKERPMVEVSAEELKNVGVNNGAFALYTDDVVEFKDDKPLVVAQKVRNTADSPVAYYVGCYRNGKPSLLSVSWFTRRDANGDPLGEFQSKNLRCANFVEIYDLWKGKTIKGGQMRSHQMPKFDPTSGQRIEGQTVEKRFADVIF